MNRNIEKFGRCLFAWCWAHIQHGNQSEFHPRFFRNVDLMTITLRKRAGVWWEGGPAISALIEKSFDETGRENLLCSGDFQMFVFCSTYNVSLVHYNSQTGEWRISLFY